MICQRQCEIAHIPTCLVGIGMMLLLTSPVYGVQTPETRVEEKKKSTEQELISQEDKNSAQPEMSLNRLKGVLINRMGGPMSPSQTVVQGFSGNRIGLSWDGFTLADPAGDFVDLTGLPFFAAQNASTAPNKGNNIGGEMNVKSLHGVPNMWQLQLLSGSQETQRVSLTWIQKLSEHLFSTTAIQAGKTKGDFEFQPKGTNADEIREIRSNNDQSRQTLFQGLTYKTSQLRQTFLFLYHQHEGGIPGFAANPFPSLRGQTQSMMLGSQTQWQRLLPGASLKIQYREKERHTFDAATPFFKNTIESYAYNWSLPYKTVYAPWQLIVKTEPETHFNALRDSSISRRGYTLPLSVKQILGANLFYWSLWQTLIKEEGFNLLPTYGGHIGSNILPSLNLKTGIRNKGRVPSLLEMYAPQGFVLGNEELVPEETQDIFATLSLNKELFGFEATVLYAQSSQLIFYVNRNAYELYPINTGETTRQNVSLKTYFQPTPHLFFQAGYDSFHTEVKATQAPLPGIPPHHFWSQMVIGPQKETQFVLNHFYRSETTGDLYGALKVAPYHLVNAQLKHPISKYLVGYLNIDNLLDVNYARDLYFLPLPGRQIFVSLEATL